MDTLLNQASQDIFRAIETREEEFDSKGIHMLVANTMSQLAVRIMALEALEVL